MRNEGAAPGRGEGFACKKASLEKETGNSEPACGSDLGPVVLQPTNDRLQKLGAHTRLTVHGLQTENHIAAERVGDKQRTLRWVLI